MSIIILSVLMVADVLLMFWLVRKVYFIYSHMTGWDEGTDQILVGKIILQLIYLLVAFAMFLALLDSIMGLS